MKQKRPLYDGGMWLKSYALDTGLSDRIWVQARVFWARLLTLTVPLSIQVHKQALENLMGVPCNEIASHSEGVEILLLDNKYQNQNKNQQYEVVLSPMQT